MNTTLIGIASYDDDIGAWISQIKQLCLKMQLGGCGEI